MCAQFVNSFIECISLPIAYPHREMVYFIFKIAVTEFQCGRIYTYLYVESVSSYAEADQIEHYLHRPRHFFRVIFLYRILLTVHLPYECVFYFYWTSSTFYLFFFIFCFAFCFSFDLRIFVTCPNLCSAYVCMYLYLHRTVLGLVKFVSFLLDIVLHQTNNSNLAMVELAVNM